MTMGRDPIHPGETLRDDLDALGMSAAELALRIQVPVNRMTEILNGRRAVTGDTALRLGRFFGTSGEFWLNLQKLYELRKAERKSAAAIALLPSLDGPRRQTARIGLTGAPPARAQGIPPNIVASVGECHPARLPPAAQDQRNHRVSHPDHAHSLDPRRLLQLLSPPTVSA